MVNTSTQPFGIYMEFKNTADPTSQDDCYLSFAPLASPFFGGSNFDFVLPPQYTIFDLVFVNVDNPGDYFTPLLTGDVSLGLEVIAVGASVPEPSTWAMMLLGFAGLGYAGYRRARAGRAAIAAYPVTK
jgi:hypothetical protein